MQANIKIKTVQRVDGESVVLELCAITDFYKKQDKYYAVYDEDESAGFGKSSRVMLKIEEDKATMTRFVGEASTRMIFAINHVHMCDYQSPIGVMQFFVKCNHIDIDVNDIGGTVDIAYALYSDEMCENIISENFLYIVIGG